MARFFLDRPIFATVLSLLIVILGTLSFLELPVSQYPEVALPTVVVRASYPGATPDVIAKTVATPLEQEINGVEGMLYMESQSTSDGSMTLTISFRLGTDLDQAQVLVQNRVAVAEPRLPEEVRLIGVTTDKSSPDLLLVVHLVSPDGTYDQLYVSNYATLQVVDTIARVDGVGDIQLFGSRDYSMRIWLDTEKLASVDLTAGDVVRALRAQNVQVAAGVIGQPPVATGSAFQLTVSTKGRLETAEEFDEIVVKSEGGRLVRVRDVGRAVLGARDYTVNSYLNEDAAVAMVVFQRPGSNALATAERVLETMEEVRRDFPAGLDYRVVYNPTVFIEESIDAVNRTLFEAAFLVMLVIFLFLQGWRATVIPLVAIPVSIIGTFILMQALGFSLNNLSLFGLVLAIGIVVDDAIVVVENVERNLDLGLSPRDATRKAMDEISSALVSTTLVLIAVFVPTAFLGGISGQFYRQFALTIAVSTAISTVVSLSLSPAMAVLFLRPRSAPAGRLAAAGNLLGGWFFRGFNRLFDAASGHYGRAVERIVRRSAVVLIGYAGLIALTWFGFRAVPAGFVPPQDQGYLVVAVQLPDGASLERTDAVTRRVVAIARSTPGIVNAVAFAGFSGATRANSPNAAAVFTGLDDFETRARDGPEYGAIVADLRARLSEIQDALIFVIQPPPVRGIGTGGGFKMQVQDRRGVGLRELQQATDTLAARANQEPGLVQVFSTFRAGVPQLFVDIDRTRSRMLDVPVESVFETLQVYLGSVYVNDFNILGRTYRVTAQAESDFRNEPGDIERLRTRSTDGALVPIGALATIEETSGPDRVVRYNLYPAADLSGDTLRGTSSDQALDAMERLAAEVLPPGIGYEWTDLAYQERQAGNAALLIFPLCVLFVFLTLAAQYESWLLPLAVILIVPMCLLCAIAGVWFRGMDNNILTQIGFVVLVGLACKNAILIVEFAKIREDEGRNRFEAAVEAAKLRLRAILMTSCSFILGVVPLVVAAGAGAEMRQALGTAVFSGMLGVTFFGLFLTPVFYVVLRRSAEKGQRAGSPPIALRDEEMR